MSSRSVGPVPKFGIRQIRSSCFTNIWFVRQLFLQANYYIIARRFLTRKTLLYDLWRDVLSWLDRFNFLSVEALWSVAIYRRQCCDISLLFARVSNTALIDEHSATMWCLLYLATSMLAAGMWPAGVRVARCDSDVSACCRAGSVLLWWAISRVVCIGNHPHSSYSFIHCY